MALSDTKTDFDVIIVGGGLAGLTAAILLARQKKKVLLIEKKSYPFHKVCGEYISNEVLGFLQSLGFDPFEYGASHISRLRISTPSGKNIYPALGLGGFGLSRYTMDEALYRIALKDGVQVLSSAKVTTALFNGNHFHVRTSGDEQFTSGLVIGCYGKRDALDKKLNRGFIQSHTGYMGVKYHVETDYPVDEIGLDNFRDGYCGIVKIEEKKYNICYLYKRSSRFHFNSIRELEESILFENPVIRKIFASSTFLFSQPEVINEISFAPKKPVEEHIFMCGDAAGLITPICGNGMSMAIHSAKILCELILDSKITGGEIQLSVRNQLEKSYGKTWNENFGRRLFIGRTIQGLFGNPLLTGTSLRCIHAIPKLERWLISGTHGNPIDVIKTV
jgi:flavin-dependent dehydrogenase